MYKLIPCLFILFFTFGFSQEPVVDTLLLKKTSKIEDLSEVLVSNTKWKQDAKSISKKAITISTKETNAQTSADLLEKSGKVFVQKSQQGGGSPMIRGFSANRLLITVDGVRMNNAIFRSGNLQNIISIDPFLLEQTEVVLGPGSVVYGSDAIGATLNFISKKPKFQLGQNKLMQGKAAYRFSSANLEQTGHVSLNYAKSKWAFLSGISFSSFDDLKQGAHGPEVYLRDNYVIRSNNQDQVIHNEDPRKQVNSGFDQLSLTQKISYKASDNLIVDLDAILNTTSDFDRYDRLIRLDDTGNFRSAEWYYGPQKWFKLSNSIHFNKASKFYSKLRLTNTYQYFKESRNERDFGSDILENTTEKLNAYNFNLDAETKLKGQYFYYGLEYIFNKVNSTAFNYDYVSGLTENSIVTRYPNGASWNSIGAYSVMNYKFNNYFTMEGGVRYNHILLYTNFQNSGFDFPFSNANLSTGALTGALGCTYKIDSHWYLKSNLGTAFRAPNIDDVGKISQDSEPGTLVVPNPNLKSEYAYNSEIALFYQNKKSHFSLSGFYTYLDRAITTDSYSLNGSDTVIFEGVESQILARQNTDYLYTYGFEFYGKFPLYKSISVELNYTLTKGTEFQSDGDEVPVRHVAPGFGKMGVLCQLKKLTLQSWVAFNKGFDFNDLAPSEQNKPYLYALDRDNNPYLPSWYTLNLSSSYRFSPKFKFDLIIENLTNQRYRTYSSGISAAGFNCVTAISYSF